MRTALPLFKLAPKFDLRCVLHPDLQNTSRIGIQRIKKVETHFICLTVVSGARAAINLNDQFGGENVIENNLIFNVVRETADHGPINSWGRQPYITKVRDGVTPSITPAPTVISRNFIISNYNGHEAVDTDDASEYFAVHHNFFVYGSNGLKSDFGGHDVVHHNNLYGYVLGRCFYLSPATMANPILGLFAPGEPVPIRRPQPHQCVLGMAHQPSNCTPPKFFFPCLIRPGLFTAVYLEVL